MSTTPPDWFDYADDLDQDDDEDGGDPGEECGRWINGHLTSSCTKAGSEECEFECPYRNTLYRRTSAG